ncbi:ABC transporter permease [Spiribacter curvatus]|uniref:ABC transporter permease n=1 Tax=Spiribacter curvatus TaxID=1335757 RepID=UPI00059EBC0A|nr:ABC transporter permease [Spiribacter curvatus]
MNRISPVGKDNQAQRRRAIFVWAAHNPAIFPFLLIVITSFVVGLINPDFWQLTTLFDVLRASVVTGLFALGVLLILAAGGLDVSFTAIAALVMYSVTLLVVEFFPDLGIVSIFLAGAVGGAALGGVNGFLVHSLQAPALIVTIGTQYALRGFLLTFIGTQLFMNIPDSMTAFGKSNLVSVTSKNGLSVDLPAYFLLLVVAALATAAILRYTIFGRAIYAVGGNPDIAARLGYRIVWIRVLVFAYAGLLAGLAGITHVMANRLANPFDLVGSELAVIAAVILGGARITGGSGNVVGTMLGVLLITLINNVLILVGIPSEWQTAILGGFILIGGMFFSLLDRFKTD